MGLAFASAGGPATSRAANASDAGKARATKFENDMGDDLLGMRGVVDRNKRTAHGVSGQEFWLAQSARDLQIYCSIPARRETPHHAILEDDGHALVPRTIPSRPVPPRRGRLCRRRRLRA